MHHRDRDVHRKGFTGYAVTKPLPRKRRRLTFDRVAPWAILALTILIFGDKLL